MFKYFDVGVVNLYQCPKCMCLVIGLLACIFSRSVVSAQLVAV